jgi:trimethylamine--corrinoid protein Co-methyltransferase
MAIRYLKGGQYRVLEDSALHNIHLAVLEVLEEVGVKLEYTPALKLMADCGCRVDFTTRIVQIPEHVLKKALSTAPSFFTLYGKVPEFDVKVDTQAIYTIGGSSALFVFDLDGQHRMATKKDLAELTRLQDALENLHIMHAIVVPQDIEQEGFDRILFSTVMKNTSRNYYSQGNGAQSIRDQIEMASVILGGSDQVIRKPIFTIVVCLTSPLVQTQIRLEELMEAAKHNIPLYIEADAQAGATTPVTLAGTLVEQTANILCGITLAQMVNPGAPCIYSIASGIMDMSTGNYSGGSPEATLLHAASAQVAHYYNLPFQGGTGIDATISDAQAGYERALQVLACALSGVNFIHLSVGMMEQMLLASYEQCVIDNEILGAALHITRGIEVNRDTLAVDVIKEVGPGGHYLYHDHTLKYFEHVNWFPKITNRKKWDAWMDDGGKDMRQQANEVARKILREHNPQHLPEDIAREIDRMAQAMQKRAIEEANITN